MGKPLLTDEIIARAKRGESLNDTPVVGDEQADEWQEEEDYLLDPLPDWEEPYTGYQEGQTVRIPVQPTIVKSRRIETVKREAFRGKVNKVLFWVVLLVIAFLLAVYYL